MNRQKLLLIVLLLVPGISLAQTAVAPLPVDKIHFGKNIPVEPTAKQKDDSDDPIDWDTYAYPVNAIEKNADGLNIFLVECNNGACVGPTGMPVGTERQIAASLPPIPGNLINKGYVCTYVCLDPLGQLVGANPSFYTHTVTHGSSPNPTTPNPDRP